MRVEGFYYPAGQSKKLAALLVCEGEDCTLSVEHEVVFQGNLSAFRISDRLGNMPRQLRFSDGELFETEGNEQIDALLRMYGKHAFSALLHRLESRAVYILPLLLVAGLSLWFVYAWGVPNAARVIAFSLPESELGIIGDHTLAALDKLALEPSQLTDEKKQRIRKRFDRLTAEVGSGFVYRLHFRRLPDNAANAFALPDGSIILMDGLVELAEHPWEIDSVLLHEIAHVEERHGLQAAFQDTLLTLIVSIMLGDAVSTAEATASLPVLLLENRYSQSFEQKADDYASDYMLKHQVDTVYFSNMLQKLELSHASKSDTEAGEEDGSESPVWDYFSTHPKTEQRLLRIKEKIIRGG